MSRVDQRPFVIQAVLLLLAVCSWDAVQAREEESPVLQRALSKLAKAYKIQIITAPHFPVGTVYGSIEGKSAKPKELREYVKLLVPEFNLYPPELVKRSKLRSVILCRSLYFSGQHRGALPDYEHHALYLDVVRGAYNEAFMRRVIHHEFFHLIDYQDDGSVYKDDRWASLNPSGFRYGKGGKEDQNREDASALTDKYPGFLDQYSTTGVEEDKAEVFSIMMVDPKYVAERSKNDGVLAAKVRLMKELLNKFCPDMNEKFWEKVKKARHDRR